MYFIEICFVGFFIVVVTNLSGQNSMKTYWFMLYYKPKHLLEENNNYKFQYSK